MKIVRVFLICCLTFWAGCNEEAPKNDTSQSEETTTEKEENTSSKSDGGAESEEALLDTSQPAVIKGQLSAGTLALDITGDDFNLGNREIKMLNNSGVEVGKATSASDGSYIVTVPGSLAFDPNITVDAFESSLALQKFSIMPLLLNPRSFTLESVVSDTKNGDVVGIQKAIEIQKSLTEMGTVDLEKITAIRGEVRLDGARDHTGITVYVPGTSYQARTDSAGKFLMTFIPPGEYQLQFEKDGYLSASLDAITVENNQTTTISKQMLELSGGASNISVKQIGEVGISRSLEVSFEINPGSADRMKVGLATELETAVYESVEESFTKVFDKDGKYRITFIFADANGFETTINRDILVDTTLPIAPNFTLKDSTSKSKSHTNSVSVDLQIADCEDVHLFYISDDPEKPNPGDFLRDCSLSEIPFQFSNPKDETKTVYLWTMDTVGNISEMANEASIILDKVKPTELSDFKLLDSTNTHSTSKYTHTNQTSVQFELAGCVSGIMTFISESQQSAPTEKANTPAVWKPCASNGTYTFIDSTEEMKTVYLWYKDEAGNIADASLSASITLDQTLPAAPTIIIQDDDDASETGYTNALKVDITLTSSCDDIIYVYGAESDAIPEESDFSLSCDIAADFYSHTFTSGEGQRTYFFWVMDSAGNISEATSTSIIVDTVTDSLSNLRVTEIGTDFVTLAWDSSSPVATHIYYGTSSGSHPNDEGASSAPGETSHTYTINGLTPGTTYYFEAQANDFAEHSGIPIEISAQTFKISKITTSSEAARLGGNSFLGYSAYSTDTLGDPIENKLQYYPNQSIVSCDLNNDGNDDAILGAPGTVISGFNRGEVHVVFGGTTYQASYSLPTDSDIVYQGPTVSTAIGFNLKCADKNGDNIPDLLIMNKKDRTYLVRGSSSISTGTGSIGSLDTYQIDLGPNDFHTYASAVGDINNDGRDDFMACILEATSKKTNQCLVYNGTLGSTNLTESDASYSLTWYGLTADQPWYGSVAGIGEVDDVAGADIIVGNSYKNSGSGSILDAGMLYVFSGGVNAPSSDEDTRTSDYLIYGAEEYMKLAYVEVHDIDSDGREDILISDGKETTDFYIVFGRTASAWGTDVEIQRNALHFADAGCGFEESGKFCDTIEVADIFGVGSNDVVVSYGGYDNMRGRVCIFRGRDQSGWNSLGPEIDMSEADICITGADSGDNLGSGFAIGNFDGSSSTLEILIGAKRADGPTDSTANTGEVVIVYPSIPSSIQKPLEFDLSPHF